GDGGNLDSQDYTFTPEQLLDNEGSALSETAFYGVAGDFSSYLLDRFGPAPYARLNPLVPRGTSTADSENAFLSVYRESLAAAFSDRRNAGTHYASSRIGFPECSIEPTPWSGSVWNLSGTVDCALNGINVYGGAELSGTYATVEIPSDGIYEIVLRGDA